jgi:glycine cleavage system H protein
MNIPPQLHYTDSHEWVSAAPDGTVSVGITDYAQEQLGDVVFLEIPELGKKYAQGAACGVVESVKAVSDLFMPVAGEIVAVNADLIKAPERVNADPYASWIFKVKPDSSGAAPQLMDAAAYAAHVGK